MKCNQEYNPTFFEKHFSGIHHFLQEKSIFTTVHPIWVIVLVFASCYITQSPIERLLVVTFAFYSVLLEMLNSSIEITNDRFGCEYNENTKIAKELAASVTCLSRIPFLSLCLLIFYRNFKKCSQLTSCS